MKNTYSPELILLVSSRADPAGSLIHEEVMRILADTPELQEKYHHLRCDERLIYLDGPSLTTEADMIIFLSRHASKEPRSVLTVHVTGNFGPAEYGGLAGDLTPAASRMMHAIMNRLNQEVPEGYEVTYEATHHGPTTIPVPSCFVEVGSTEVEWQDRNAAAAVARAVVGAVPGDVVSLAGFGGTHYAKRQTEITLTTRGGFGHIMPTRDLLHLNLEMFSTIIHESGADAIYIDRKSVSGEEIRKIEGYAATLLIPVVGQSDLKGLKDISFNEYLAITRLAESVLVGSSVTLHALEHIHDPVTVTIPEDLVAEAAKVDPTGLNAGLDLLQVAHLSGKGIAYYSTFITDQKNNPDISDDLINLCVSILHRNCDCRFEGGCLIIAKPRYDPEKAKMLGIPPGPAAGRLMAGEVIVVNDTEITPAMVMITTEKKICIPGWGTR